MKKLATSLILFLRRINLARYIAKNLLGDKASARHRKISGIALMVVGVGLTQLAALCEVHFVHFLAEILRDGLGGVGILPFVDAVEKMAD